MGQVDEVYFADALMRRIAVGESREVPAGCSIVVRGWALNPEPPRPADRLCFTIGPQETSDLSYGLDRNDVAEAMSDPSCAASGFKRALSLNGLPLGTHSLRILAIDRERSGYYALDDEPTFVIVESRRLFSGTSAVAGRMQFGIDRLETTSGRRDFDGNTLHARIGDTVVASGWVIDRDQRSTVGDVFGLADDRYTLAVSGMPRPDISTSLGLPSALACGFVLRIQTCALSAGMHDLSLVAVARKDSDYEVIPVGRISLSPATAPEDDVPYVRWMIVHNPSESDFAAMRTATGQFDYPPLISIIMPVFDTSEKYLRAAIESVRRQIYPHWELCIEDDISSSPEQREVLAEYAAIDARIKIAYRPDHAHKSHVSNAALELATGEFVGFLDHDDELAREALYEIANLINHHADADMMYSDEDKIHDDGRRTDPYFKPDWCPDSFLSRMYTCHFGVYRRALVEAVGRLRPEFEGSQEYDLALRLTERTTRIHHIPKVLYHRRVHPASVAGDTSPKQSTTATERALNEALVRRNEPGVARSLPDGGICIVRYEIRSPGRVSVIIPTRDHGEDVDRCLTTLFEKTTYGNFEVVLLDNGSTDPGSLAVFDAWAKMDRRIRIVRYDVPFNYSKINNYAVTQSNGSYLLFLNNDTEIITPDWMEAMVEQAQRPTIGAVGGLLLYPDGSVQHAGVVIGLGGVAGHSHKHYSGEASGYFSALKAVNNYSAVTGACMMVRRDVFESVGGFEEKLAVAFNDVDFCLKLRQAGYQNVYLPHVKLYHHESKSRGYETTPERQARFEQEIHTIKDRWRPDVNPDPCYSPNLTLNHENFSIRV